VQLRRCRSRDEVAFEEGFERRELSLQDGEQCFRGGRTAAGRLLPAELVRFDLDLALVNADVEPAVAEQREVSGLAVERLNQLLVGVRVFVAESFNRVIRERGLDHAASAR